MLIFTLDYIFKRQEPRQVKGKTKGKADIKQKSKHETDVPGTCQGRKRPEEG